MTKSDILAMAREAGLMWPVDDSGIGAALDRFAGLVAAAEREACADLCEQEYTCKGIAQKCAEAIRSRESA